MADVQPWLAAAWRPVGVVVEQFRRSAVIAPPS